MSANLILRYVTKLGSKKGTVKVFRGDTSKKTTGYNMDKFYKDNPIHKTMDKQNMGKRFPEIKKKRDLTRGRWFTTDKEIAKSYKSKKDGVVLEAEISKKDLILGDKMKKKFFKGVDISDDTILLPRKNLKDVVKSKKMGGMMNYYKDII